MSDGIVPAPVIFSAIAIIGLLAFTLGVGALLWPYINGGKGTHKGERAPFRRPQPAPRHEPGVADWLDELAQASLAAAEAKHGPFLPAPIPHDSPDWPMAPQVTAPLDPSAVLTPAQAAEMHSPDDSTLWNLHRIEPGPAVWEQLALEAGAS